MAAIQRWFAVATKDEGKKCDACWSEASIQMPCQMVENDMLPISVVEGKDLKQV